MIHRINIFLLSLFVALAPNFIFLQAANATTVSAEGWSVTKRLVQGATTFYDGAKTVVLNGKNYAAVGSAAITPVASQVAKMIVTTGAVFAVDLAIKALLGSVDYVMDPANNRVIYYPGSVNYTCVAGSVTRTAPTLDIAAQSTCQAFTANVTYQGISKVSDSQYKCLYKNAGGDQSYTMSCYTVNVNNHDKPEYLPYETVASQIISDAISNKESSKAYVSSVADTALDSDERTQLVPASNVVNQLNNSQSISTNQTAQGQAVPQADPNNPSAPKAPPTDITINFPVFCSWAPTVCQAAQAAIEFPKTFLEKFTKWDDWINRETKPYTADETTIDTSDKRTFDFSIFNANRFSVNPQCPTPEPTTLTVLNVQTVFSFDLKPICSILEMAKPALIACSYLYAAYIVIGASRG